MNHAWPAATLRHENQDAVLQAYVLFQNNANKLIVIDLRLSAFIGGLIIFGGLSASC